jgi:hypothetical protein
MVRFPILLRGLLLAGAVAVISIPAAAEAGGGYKGFCGTYGGGYGGFHGGGCYKPSFCYQPSYCYRPPVYCQPVYRPYVPTYCAPTVSCQMQPWIFNCHQPHFGGGIVIQSR